MTYCVGILVEGGLVMIADTRTNAGVDNIATFRKLHLFEVPGAINGPFVVGVLTAGVVGAFSIGILMRYLRHTGLEIFVVYRLVLAVLIVATILLGLR